MNRNRINLLSLQEKEVLRFAGFTEKEIGKKLFISHLTVHQHLMNSYQILGVSNRASAVIEAIRLKEINIDEVITK